MSDTSNTIALHLRKLEQDLLQPEIRKDSEAVADLITDDFYEFGSSGRVFSKPEIIQALQTEEPAQLSIADFHVRSLTPGIALVTYRAVKQGETGEGIPTSLRSSLWVMRDGRWQMLFHQGTIIPG
jgi:hypothetical protein